MPDYNTTHISKGRKATIVVLIILLLIVLFLNIVGASRAPAKTEPRSFLGRTIDQVSDTFSVVRDYVWSMFTGNPLPERNPEKRDEEKKEAIDNTSKPLSPPLSLGTTTILNSSVLRSIIDRGTFIVNTNLRANGDFDISGETRASDVTASGTIEAHFLTVEETLKALGLINALGGIKTGGASINLEGGDINLEGGDIIGLNYIKSIQAGENVVITGTPDNLIISVPNASRRSGGGGGSSSAGVSSLNGQTGPITLIAGTDIAITGLSIENISTLGTVRARGGCVGCILDADVADNLTITGGTINDTIIGATNSASGFFTGLSVGTTDTTHALNVLGDGSFSGKVSGAQATNLNEFVTLAQLNAALGGGGGVAGVASLNSLTGALFIAGTAGQITVTDSGSTLTLSLPQNISQTGTPIFAGLTLNGSLTATGDADITGVVTAGSFVSDPGDATVRKSGEEIFRMSTSIFPYALPADTGSSSFMRMSDKFTSTFDNPLSSSPTPIPGTTREYKFVIKYADSIPTSSNSSWRIYKPSDSSIIDTFTLPGLNKTSLDEPEIVVVDSLTIPTGDWELEVSVPSGRIRVMDIHIVAFDVVN